MGKYLVIRDYLTERITPSVAGQFDDFGAARKFANDKNKGNKELVKYFVFEQCK